MEEIQIAQSNVPQSIRKTESMESSWMLTKGRSTSSGHGGSVEQQLSQNDARLQVATSSQV